MATYENWFSRRKGKPSGNIFKLDVQNKTPEQNIIEIIQGLYLKKSGQNETSPTNKSVSMDYRPGFRLANRNSSDSGRLSYLNALVTLLSNENSIGFTTDELMLCIRASLVDESMVIRATALRVLRYLIKTESDVATFNNLKLSYLIMRSIDLILRNEEERTQALRVVRRIIAVVGGTGQVRRHRAAYIDPGLLRCMAAVARAGSGGDGSGDRLAKPAVATLAEMCVINPELFISCGGVNAVLRQLSECATPRMAEALCGVLLHTMNDPMYRNIAKIDLTCLSAPYCDFHVRPAGTDSTRDEREMRFTCSRLALLCVLRSWPGLLHFCHPYTTGGLRALVQALYLPRLEVRKAILDLLYELVGLPQPEWTDELSVALDAVDPSDFQDSWRLNEGFVAAEGIAILPHLSATGLDITEIHLALLLQCFLEVGLLDALAEVIVTSDTFISVRATVLLGQLLHLVHLFLPPQICSITPALPSLLSQAAAGKPQALAAVAALRRLHNMLESRPASNSLFLDHIIQYCSGAFREKDEDATKSRKEKNNANMAKPKVLNTHQDSIEFLNESDSENQPKQRHSIGSRADIQSRNMSALVKSKSVSSRTTAAVNKVFGLFEKESDSLIRGSLVMQNKDGNTWNWEVIRTIMKENGAPILNLNDNGHKAWAARIVNYLKPSANKYSHTDLSSTCYGHSATRAGCQLIRHLLAHNDAESQRLLEDLFFDVSHQIEAIETGRKAHECLFSPQHMCNTMCQMYFLFIGQLCHSHNGLRLFKQTKLYENLLELSTKTHHSCYVKLVISSLDYTLDSYPRDILAKTLTCNIIPSRTYATQFLNVLLRASKKSRELIRRKSKKVFIYENTKFNKEGSDNDVDMDTWIIQMLIGQLKDESKGVIKCALSILEEAYSVNSFLEKMIPMRHYLAQNCHLDRDADPSTFDLSTVGDRGYLIWLGLEVAASAQNPDANAFIKRHLDYWTNNYNYRYVRLVECAAHCALTVSGRERGGGRRAPPPPHLHAALAALAPAPAHVDHHQYHHKILQRKKCANEQEIADLKASLWAIGHSCVTSQGLQQVMSLTNGYLEDSVPVHVVRLVKYCSVYSVRATAFYVLALIGSTFDGANLLSDLGWHCVRHTRHDQFPIIPDETYPSVYDSSGNMTSFITSPDRRYNAFDVEISEHSDHTDQSIVESLQSDYIKNVNKTIESVIESEERDQDVVDHKLSSIEKKETDKRKSHTLPTQGCSTTHERPTLSESRTVDILRDYSNYERNGSARNEHRILNTRINSLDHTHEGRVRNTSESSTSGVSSCDSFLGKYTIPDRVVLTLSPIPSSSSLYGMKGSNSSHRPKLTESMRRTSTSSFNTPDVSSSPPTQLDMTGYETLKSIYRNRRPHLSESAASSSEMDDLTWLLTETHKKSNKPFLSLRERTKTSRERKSKLSIVEYDWRPLPLCAGRGPPPPPPRSAPPAPPAPPAPRRYMPVCLPASLADLFPRDLEGKELDHFLKQQPRRRAPSFLLESSNASTDNKSRATPDSHNFSYKGIDVVGGVGLRLTNMTTSKHSAKTNIDDKRIDMTDIVAGMTAMTTSIEASEHKAKTKTDAEDSKTEDKRANEMERDSESGANSSKANALNMNSVPKWRHVSADCLVCVKTRPPSSHELREAFFGGNATSSPQAAELEGPPESPQAQLLFHAAHMSNPIHLKQTRAALLTLKQRHPDVFRNACVYSDLCALLSRDTYMLCARRFLQELFLDTNFQCFAAEPLSVLARHVTSSNATPSDAASLPTNKINVNSATVASGVEVAAKVTADVTTRQV